MQMDGKDPIKKEMPKVGGREKLLKKPGDRPEGDPKSGGEGGDSSYMAGKLPHGKRKCVRLCLW